MWTVTVSKKQVLSVINWENNFHMVIIKRPRLKAEESGQIITELKLLEHFSHYQDSLSLFNGLIYLSRLCLI